MKELIFSSLLFLIPASFIEQLAHVNVRDISGKVIGFDDSLPLEGVTVSIKGTLKSTGTQADGNFYIRVHAPEDSVLIFSLPGYKTQELKLSSKEDYDVVLTRAGQ